MRSRFVEGVRDLMTVPMSMRSRGRWTTTPSRFNRVTQRWTITSTGSWSGRSIPHNTAAERCDATAVDPAASTAAWIRCTGVFGVPWRRATSGCTRCNWPRRIARYHAASVQPRSIARRLVTTPWCDRAHSSSFPRFTPPWVRRRRCERKPNPFWAAIPIDCRRRWQPRTAGGSMRRVGFAAQNDEPEQRVVDLAASATLRHCLRVAHLP